MGISSLVFAQEIDYKGITELKQNLEEKNIENKVFLQQFANKKGIDITEINKNFVGKFGNFLVYIEPTDADQIKAANVDRLYDGTIPDVNITGGGMQVYQWDEGRVSNHLELTERVTNMEDESTNVAAHSTGTAGIIIASGINPNAKGMAPDAELFAYDYSDNFNEILAESENPANSEYLISNHSYGYSAGWRNGIYDEEIGSMWYWFGYPHIDENESVYYGIYSDLDDYFDQISVLAPQHLIIKAAGNDRNSGPNGVIEHAAYNEQNEWQLYTAERPANCGQTGYDCLPYGSTAKNILLVGSIQQIQGDGRYIDENNVTASNFSSFGPTDDGRIKPEIVAQGSSVIKPFGTEDYNNNSNGTSN